MVIDLKFREKIVADVVGNILGPRYGLHEIFHEKMNPWKLYLTGVLAPREIEEDEDGSENNISGNTYTGQEDQTFDKVNDPIEYTPSLNSNSQPRSMGLSFVVSTIKNCPKFDICFTWARYIWHQNWDKLLADNIDNSGKFDGWNNPKIMKEKFFRKKEEIDPIKRISRGRNIPNGRNNDSNSKNLINRKNKLDRDVLFGGWKRNPQYLILHEVKIYPKKLSYDIAGSQITNNASETTFYKIGHQKIDNDQFQITIKIKYLSPISKTRRFYKISIFFLNTSKRFTMRGLDKIDKLLLRGERINRFIFQPQIRANCIGDTRLEPFDLKSYDESLDDNEENNLKMLYFDVRPKARGHMCGAIWSNIDPQKDPDEPLLRKTTSGPPFNWIDGDFIESKVAGIKKLFFPPDLRTEFVPIIPVSAPDFNWKNIRKKSDKWEATPISLSKDSFLDAEYLAEKCYDPVLLRSVLSEIVREYENWRSWKKDEISGTSLEWAIKIANNNLEKHNELIKRITRGIEILCNNDNARLAFCFANKAISLQNRWKKKYSQGEIVKSPTEVDPFIWRPFQISFILLLIASIVEKTDIERDIVDLIWIPTGGGKTEAYLGITAFSIAYRRRMGIIDSEQKRDILENGIYLISRYTLRLLAIQQFRRATKLIVACEYLRIQNLNDKIQGEIIGWLPESLIKSKEGYETTLTSVENGENWVYGTTRISIGLWVGGTLTPNRLERFWDKRSKEWVFGAIEALKVRVLLKYMREPVNVLNFTSDPGQITTCPVCNCFLSLPKQQDQYLPEKMNIFLMVKKENTDPSQLEKDITDVIPLLRPTFFNLERLTVERLNSTEPNFYSIGLKLSTTVNNAEPVKLKEWWDDIVSNVIGMIPINPDIRNSGYFYLFENSSNIEFERITTDSEYTGIDFEIRCCNPKCELNEVKWAEEVHVSRKSFWTQIQSPWKLANNKLDISIGMPITAYTVDEQVYRRIPTILIGTVDKFAQLSFKDEAGSIFGNVDFFNSIFGFFRNRALPKNRTIRVDATLENPFDPPEIILQDELHLIEGVLGSMVGIYETLIDELSTRYDTDGNIIHKPKYIASTATIRAGKDQVKCLFNRSYSTFPSPGIKQEDSFFLTNRYVHALNEDVTGRLYIGVCCPGKSPQKPLTHIWGQLFQTPYEIKNEVINSGLNLNQKKLLLKNLDRFWTVVGYFNAIRELAGTRAIYIQEFITWMELLYGATNYRNIIGRIDDPIELSSRTDSIMLPSYFEKLKNPLELIGEDPIHGLLTTSMFGTGVDVSRLGVMIVNGQPKTSASYIQATGRIGREKGGIVVTYLNPKRPRDLDHYEQFSGYHTSLYKNVEPITVSPFAPQCVSITIGPILVAFLRQSINIRNVLVSEEWRNNDEGPYYINSGTRVRKGRGNPDYDEFLKIIQERLGKQPTNRRFDISEQLRELEVNYNRWYDLIVKNVKIKYVEYTLSKSPEVSVVLGDPQHQTASKLQNSEIRVVFENAPNSLRGVEPTTTFDFFVTQSSKRRRR